MARDTRREYADRNIAAREEGWSSYGQKRRALENVDKELKLLHSKGQIPSVPERGSYRHRILVEAYREIKVKTPKGTKAFEKGTRKISDEMRERILKAFGRKSGTGYQLLRSLY